MALGISIHHFKAHIADPDEISAAAFSVIDETPASWLRSDYYWDHLTNPHVNNPTFVSRAHTHGKHVLYVIDWWSFANAWTSVLASETLLRAKLATILADVPDADAFEIWNEPNIITGVDPPWAGTYIDGTAESYLDFLQICSDEIRARCPKALVVCGGLGNDIGALSVEPAEWLQTLTDLGGMDYCDKVAIHPYIASRAVTDIVEAKSITSKPVWVTEMGWPSTGGAGYTEADQATKLTDWMTSYEPYAEVVMWYCLCNYSTRVGGANHYGLTSTTFSGKQSLTAYKALNPLTPPCMYQLYGPQQELSMPGRLLF